MTEHSKILYEESLDAMKRTGLSASLLILSLAACSPQTVYEGIRSNRALECQKMQGADRAECAERPGMSYDEYQRQMKNQPTN